MLIAVTTATKSAPLTLHLDFADTQNPLTAKRV